jgi:hypothetical protein
MTQPEANARDLDFEQIAMLANFSDYAATIQSCPLKTSPRSRRGFQQSKEWSGMGEGMPRSF